MTLIVLLVAALALTEAVLLATTVLQDRLIRRQKQTLEIQTRTVSRERARAEILQAELDHLARSSRIVTLWRDRQVKT